MGSPGALMRAAQMKVNLRGLDGLAERHSVDLRAALSTDTARAVERAMRTDWLPVSLDIEMTEAVDRVLGRELLRRWSKQTILKSTRGPLLGPLFDGAVALFGLRPHTFLKLAPRGWGSVYRGCGELKVSERAPTRARLSWVGVPEELLGSEPYHHGLAASFEALLELAKVAGRCDPERGPGTVLEFRASWA